MTLDTLLSRRVKLDEPDGFMCNHCHIFEASDCCEPYDTCGNCMEGKMQPVFVVTQQQMAEAAEKLEAINGI